MNVTMVKATHSGTVSAKAGATANYSQGLTQTVGLTRVFGTLNASETVEGGVLGGCGQIFGNVTNTGGTVESVKAVSDLYSPVSGEVVDSNSALSDATETVNQDPFGGGWMIRIRLSDRGDLEELLTATEYDQLAANASH